MDSLMNWCKCPKCGDRIEYKFYLRDCDDEEDNPPAVYQCPKCKNIEVL